MKKILAYFVIIAVLITMFNGNCCFAVEETTVMGEKLTVASGTTFEYRVSIRGNPGLTGIGLRLIFDTDALSLVYDGDHVDCVRGDFSSSGSLYCGPTSNGCNIVWSNSADVAMDGTLLVLKLEAKEDAAPGSYDIQIQNVAQNTINMAEDLVPLSCISGAVRIRTYQPLIFGENVETKIGETVEYCVFLQDNPGVAACDIIVQFNSDCLQLEPFETNEEYTAKANGGIMQGSIVSKVYSNAIEVLWSNATEIKTEGALFKLRFKAKENAPPGEYPVSVSYVEDNTLNSNEQTVAFVTANGVISLSYTTNAHVSGGWNENRLFANVTTHSNSLLVASCFDSTGKQVAVKLVIIEAACADKRYDTGLSRLNGDTYKLMLVNKSTFVPFCEAWTNMME